MSASVFIACNTAGRKVPGSTVQLTLESSRDRKPQDAPASGMLILNKSSLPLYAIRQQDSEKAASDLL